MLRGTLELPLLMTAAECAAARRAEAGAPGSSSPRERGQASNSEERVADSEGEYDAEKAPAARTEDGDDEGAGSAGSAGDNGCSGGAIAGVDGQAPGRTGSTGGTGGGA